MIKFLLPIEYSKGVKETSHSLIDDLEIINSKSDISCVYKELFQPKTEFGINIYKDISKSYTTDKKYLKDTQKFHNIYKPELNLDVIEKFNSNFNNINNNNNFLRDYQYLDIKQLAFLNKNELFLQLYSIYNISSPAISLLYPIVIFIIPFLLIRLNHPNLSLYIKNY